MIRGMLYSGIRLYSTYRVRRHTLHFNLEYIKSGRMEHLQELLWHLSTTCSRLATVKTIVLVLLIKQLPAWDTWAFKMPRGKPDLQVKPLTHGPVFWHRYLLKGSQSQLLRRSGIRLRRCCKPSELNGRQMEFSIISYWRYPTIAPFLRGVHRTLDRWRPG